VYAFPWLVSDIEDIINIIRIIQYTTIINGETRNNSQLFRYPNLPGRKIRGKGKRLQHRYNLALLCHFSFARQQIAMRMPENQSRNKHSNNPILLMTFKIP